MKIKKDLKMGILAGTTGFLLTFLFWYLTTGIFELRFPAVIGVGFFCGGFLGSMLSTLYKHGEERKVKLAILILICLLIILNVHYLLESGMGPGWRWVLSISTIVGCIALGYFTMSSLIVES